MRYTEFYPLRPESVGHARQDFRAAVTRSALFDSVAEAAELCLSELASNAVRHAHDPRPRRWFHVSCHVQSMRHRALRLVVHDVDSAHIPVMPRRPVDPLAALDEEAESGRGLLLIAGTATACGVEHGEGVNGKNVWCTFDLPEPTVPELADPRIDWAAIAAPCR
jgi:anti-sigma regulatory factor (Ser/Thr protein kinase)